MKYQLLHKSQYQKENILDELLSEINSLVSEKMSILLDDTFPVFIEKEELLNLARQVYGNGNPSLSLIIDPYLPTDCTVTVRREEIKPSTILAQFATREWDGNLEEYRIAWDMPEIILARGETVAEAIATTFDK